MAKPVSIPHAATISSGGSSTDQPKSSSPHSTKLLFLLAALLLALLNVVTIYIGHNFHLTTWCNKWALATFVLLTLIVAIVRYTVGRADYGDDTLLRLFKIGWAVSSTDLSSGVESLCVSLLQHVSGKFWFNINLDKVCYAECRDEWQQFTASLGSNVQRHVLLNKLLEICGRDVSSRNLQLIISCFREYFPEQLGQRPVAIIKSDELKLLGKDLESYLKCKADAGVILLLRHGDKFHALIPESEAYSDVESHAEGIVSNLETYALFELFFKTWLQWLLNSRIEDLNHGAGKITDQISQCESFTGLRQVLDSVTLRKGGGDELHALRRLDLLYSKQRHEFQISMLDALKRQVCSSLMAVVRSYFTQRADEHRLQAEQVRSELQEMKEEMETIQARLEELGAEREAHTEQRAKLQERLLWLTFKMNISTSTPNSSETLATVLAALATGNTLVQVADAIRVTFGLPEFDVKLTERLQLNAKEDRDDLHKFLAELDHMAFTFDHSSKVLQFEGVHLQLRRCIPEIEKHVKAFPQLKEIRLMAQRSGLIDVSLPNEWGHGRNLVLCAESIVVASPDTPRLLLDVSGVNGRSHDSRKPELPDAPGIPGTTGLDGVDGESSGHVYIRSVKPAIGLACLEIRCNGGSGSDAQHGGDGSDGRNGDDGKEGEISEEPPTNLVVSLPPVVARGEIGERGGDGGGGGTPGFGGAGGAAGDIQISSAGSTLYVSGRNDPTIARGIPDLQYERKDGLGGLNGAPGAAGTHGRDGVDGLDNTWHAPKFWAWNPWEKFSGIYIDYKLTNFDLTLVSLAILSPVILSPFFIFIPRWIAFDTKVPKSEQRTRDQSRETTQESSADQSRNQETAPVKDAMNMSEVSSVIESMENDAGRRRTVDEQMEAALGGEQKDLQARIKATSRSIESGRQQLRQCEQIANQLTCQVDQQENRKQYFQSQSAEWLSREQALLAKFDTELEQQNARAQNEEFLLSVPHCRQGMTLGRPDFTDDEEDQDEHVSLNLCCTRSTDAANFRQQCLSLMAMCDANHLLASAMESFMHQLGPVIGKLRPLLAVAHHLLTATKTAHNPEEAHAFIRKSFPQQCKEVYVSAGSGQTLRELWRSFSSTGIPKLEHEIEMLYHLHTTSFNMDQLRRLETLMLETGAYWARELWEGRVLQFLTEPHKRSEGVGKPLGRKKKKKQPQEIVPCPEPFLKDLIARLSHLQRESSASMDTSEKDADQADVIQITDILIRFIKKMRESKPGESMAEQMNQAMEQVIQEMTNLKLGQVLHAWRTDEEGELKRNDLKHKLVLVRAHLSVDHLGQLEEIARNRPLHHLHQFVSHLFKETYLSPLSARINAMVTQRSTTEGGTAALEKNWHQLVQICEAELNQLSCASKFRFYDEFLRTFDRARLDDDGIAMTNLLDKVNTEISDSIPALDAVLAEIGLLLEGQGATPSELEARMLAAKKTLKFHLEKCHSLDSLVQRESSLLQLLRSSVKGQFTQDLWTVWREVWTTSTENIISSVANRIRFNSADADDVAHKLQQIVERNSKDLVKSTEVLQYLQYKVQQVILKCLQQGSCDGIHNSKSGSGILDTLKSYVSRRPPIANALHLWVRYMDEIIREGAESDWTELARIEPDFWQQITSAHPEWLQPNDMTGVVNILLMYMDTIEERDQDTMEMDNCKAFLQLLEQIILRQHAPELIRKTLQMPLAATSDADNAKVVSMSRDAIQEDDCKLHQQLKDAFTRTADLLVESLQSETAKMAERMSEAVRACQQEAEDVFSTFHERVVRNIERLFKFNANTSLTPHRIYLQEMAIWSESRRLEPSQLLLKEDAAYEKAISSTRTQTEKHIIDIPVSLSLSICELCPSFIGKLASTQLKQVSEDTDFDRASTIFAQALKEMRQDDGVSNALDYIGHGLQAFLNPWNRARIWCTLFRKCSANTELMPLDIWQHAASLARKMVHTSSHAASYFRTQFDEQRCELLLRGVRGRIEADEFWERTEISSERIAIALLNESEAELLRVTRAQFGKASKLPLPFPLDLMRETKDPRLWEDLIFRWYHESSLAQMLNPMDSAEARNLSTALVQWNASHGCVEGQTDSSARVSAWTTTFVSVMTRLSHWPISNAKLLDTVRSASKLPLDQFQRIVDTRFPANWLRQSLLARIRNQLPVKADGAEAGHGEDFQLEYVSFMQTLEDWSEAKSMLGTGTRETRRQRPLLEQTLRLLCKKLEEASDGLPNADELNDLCAQLTRTELDIDLLLQLGEIPLPQWIDVLCKWKYRKMGYTNIDIMDHLAALEAKFGDFVPRFATLMQKHIPRSTKEQNTCLQSLRDGRWTLNALTIEKLESAQLGFHLASLNAYFDEYMRCQQDLAGHDLVQSLRGMKLNKRLSNNRTSLDALEKSLDGIRTMYNEAGKARLLSTPLRAISAWSTDDIRKWLTRLRGGMREHKEEILAVIKRGARLCDPRGKVELRETQLATVLLYIQAFHGGRNGRVGEVATSEGKTYISATLAIYLSLLGYKGTIVSSSPTLAIKGSNDMKSLFQLFNIGMCNICDKASGREKGDMGQMEKCYGSRVIYSDVASLQGDFLQNHYLGKRFMRGERDYVIVDEVDSLLLDKGANVLYLSHTVPELRQLRQLLVSIWNMVKGGVAEHDILPEIHQQVEKGEIRLTKFLKTFVECRLVRWINSALEAQAMEEQNPYILSSKVVVMDLPTGEALESTQYSYGLHQFLQLKHGKKITLESLKAFFISNQTYFRSFGHRIFGITGTIGCNSSVQLLRKIYNVDFFKMSRYRLKRCRKEEGLIATDGEDHLKKMANSICARLGQQPVLCICPNVKEAENLVRYLEGFTELRRGDRRRRLLKYVSSIERAELEAEELRMEVQILNTDIPELMVKDVTQKVLDKLTLQPGDILVSTNLAGRGTDLDVAASCDKTGGLHVILTYMPSNERIEKQAFGRTSRAGKNGSTQYIVLQKTDEQDHTMSDYRKQMNRHEAERLRTVKEIQMPHIALEGELLKRFQAFQHRIVARYFARDSQPVAEAKTHLLRSRWAFWLDAQQAAIEMSVHMGGKDRVLNDFDDFGRELEAKIQNGKLCDSCDDFIRLAAAYEELGCITMAIEQYLQAIDAEPEFNEVAHYYLGICLLKLDAQKKNRATRWLARHHLKIARSSIQRRMDDQDALKGEYMRTKSLLQEEADDQDKITLYEQFKVENQIYTAHVGKLEQLVGTELSEKSFNELPLVNFDEQESADIFQAVQSFVKPMRLSKRLEVVYDRDVGGETRLVAKLRGKVCQFSAAIEQSRHSILQEIRNILCTRGTKSELALGTIPDVYRHHIEGSKGKMPAPVSYSPSLVIGHDSFKKIAVSKAQLWDVLVQANFIQDSTQEEYLVINFDEDIFQQDKDQILQGIDPVVRLFLSENHMRPLADSLPSKTDPNFPLLQTLVTGGTQQDLHKAGALVLRRDWTGTISEPCWQKLKLSNDFALLGLPADLCKYVDLLQNWIVCNDLRNPPRIQKCLSTRNLLTVPDNSDDAQATLLGRQEILSELRQLGILKDPKLDWRFASHFGEERARRKWLKKNMPEARLKTVYRKFHAWKEDEFQQYVKHIRKQLVASAGLAKTITDLKVEREYTSIAVSLPDPTGAGTELADFRTAHFHRVATVTKAIPWWSWSAAAVVLLGILQIAAGVAIGVLSAGTLTNLSMMLIGEGAGDMIYGIQSGLSGNFSWKAYGINKAISVTVSVVTGGLAGIRAGTLALRGGMLVAKAVFKEAVITAGRYLLQGLASSGIGMVIEKVVSWCRAQMKDKLGDKLSEHLETSGFQSCLANVRVRLDRLHELSFHRHQMSSILESAIKFIHDAKSHYCAELWTAAKKVANYWTKKLFTYLGSTLGKYNIVSSLSSIFGAMTTFLKSCTLPADFASFAHQHTTRFCDYFDAKAKELERKRKRMEREQSTTDLTFHVEPGHVNQNARNEQFFKNLKEKLKEDYLNKVQEEMVEPKLKALANRAVHAGSNLVFKSKEAAMLKRFDSITKHGIGIHFVDAKVGSTRELSKPRNNVFDIDWATHFRPDNKMARAKEVVDRIGSEFICFVRRPGTRLSDHLDVATTPVFILDDTSKDDLQTAIDMNVAVIRRIQLPLKRE